MLPCPTRKLLWAEPPFRPSPPASFSSSLAFLGRPRPAADRMHTWLLTCESPGLVQGDARPSSAWGAQNLTRLKLCRGWSLPPPAPPRPEGAGRGRPLGRPSTAYSFMPEKPCSTKAALTPRQPRRAPGGSAGARCLSPRWARAGARGAGLTCAPPLGPDLRPGGARSVPPSGCLSRLLPQTSPSGRSWQGPLLPTYDLLSWINTALSLRPSARPP